MATRSGSLAQARTGQPVVETIVRRSLHKEVVEELGHKIVAGELGQGGILPTEPQLAADLGVSRNVLREAIKVLAAKGLVEVRPKTGTRVRPESDWNLLDREVLAWQVFSAPRLPHSFNLAEFRLIVEPKAAFLAARRASAEDIEAIDRACTALEACVGHTERVPQVDIVFHCSIHRASHNAILNNIGTLIASLMQIQIPLTTIEPGSFERELPLHRELTEAIRRHDAAAAEDAARRLCEMPYLDLAGRIDSKSDRGLLASEEPTRS